MEEQKHKNQLNSKNININLNSIQEEEKIRNNKELQDNNSEDENLGYNANYNINKNGTYNIISKNSGELRLNSKESTVSTAVSQNELYLEQITSLYIIEKLIIPLILILILLEKDLIQLQ